MPDNALSYKGVYTIPYIKQADRPLWDVQVHDVVDMLADTGMPAGIDGQLNYFITKLVLRVLKPKSYSDYQRVVGLLECIKLELARTQLAPYEDIKRGENGPVG